MRIIICGAGRVGQGIAERLAIEHTVTVIDEDSQLVERITQLYEVRGITGHAAHPNVLKKAGADGAEMIIAVTYSDEVNMITCQVAHSLFKVTNKIARIRSQEYLKPQYKSLFSQDNIPIDLHISPEVEVSESILKRLETPGAFLTANFANGLVNLVGVEVPEKSPLVDASIEDVYSLLPDTKARIVAIARDKNIFAAKLDETLITGDRIYWIAPRSNIEHMFTIMELLDNSGRLVTIVGAGNIGLNVARKLEKQNHMRVRLIEKNENVAERAAEKLNRAIVIQGDGLDPAVLEEAGAGQADLVIGLTSDDKTNLLLGPLAKDLGAKKVVSLINETDLINIRSNIGVDALIDPRGVTVSRILLQLRHGRLSGLQTLENGAAEVVEGIVRETSSLVGMELLSGDLPEGLAPGAIVRDGELIELNERVRIGDTVILFAEREMARKVDQLYRVKPEFY